jgi:hypothetical protein
MRTLSVPVLMVIGFIIAFAAPPSGAADYSPRVKKAVNSISGKEIQRHIEVLASDAYEGREAGKRGAFFSGCYIAHLFEQYGLKPGGEGGTYFQSFSLGRGGAPKDAGMEDTNLLEMLVITRRKAWLVRFEYNKDFIPFRFSGSRYCASSAVIAGYGITAPEYGYDDYKGLDVKGKIVILLSHEPQEKDPESVFKGVELTKHADPIEKARLAEKNGAVGVLIVPNPLHHEKDPLAVDKVTAWPPGGGAEGCLGIPCARCSMNVVNEILKVEKKKLKKIQQDIDRSLKPVKVKIEKCALTFRIQAQADRHGMGRNVIGIYEGSDPGFGHFASRGKPGEVHNGANDNASGTAGVIALARAITELEVKTKRTLVFAAFDGEEKGLIGSKHYVQSPVIPIKKTIAMLNMDMIGRGPVRKIKVGGGTLNPTLQGILSRISGRFRLGLDLKGLDAFLRNSDQAPFMDKGIPCIFLSSGLYNGLHSHEDDAHLMNQTKLEAIVRTMMLVAAEVANLKKRP